MVFLRTLKLGGAKANFLVDMIAAEKERVTIDGHAPEFPSTTPLLQ